MKLNRWNWGYVPVIVVLGLVWFEFWKSGAFVAPPPRPDAPETQAETPAIPAPAILPVPAVSTPPVVVQGTNTMGNMPPISVGPISVGPSAVGPNVPPAIATPEPAPRAPVIDDKFFNDPPPITVSFNNATPDMVVAALRKSFDMPSYLFLEESSQATARFSMDAKNTSFWDVIKGLQAQGPIAFNTAGNMNGQGLMLTTQNSPIYRFQTNGPAILYPIGSVYTRSGSAQAAPGNRGTGSYTVTLGAAVDPRLLVVRSGGIELLEAVDEAGRAIPVPGPANISSSNSNYWQASASFPAPEQRPHRATFKCQLHFGVQLPTGMLTLDEPAQEVGKTLTVGDRTIRLERFELQNGTLSVQVSGDQPGGANAPFNCLLVDARGRTATFPTTNMRSFSTSTYVAPYKLVVMDPNAVRELSFAFELKDIVLP